MSLRSVNWSVGSRATLGDPSDLYRYQNYTEQYKGAAAHTVTTRLQVRKGETQVDDGDYERRRETSSSFVFLHSNPCIIIGYN